MHLEIRVSHLKDGKIPVRTVCPFREQCIIAQEGSCHHQGINHEREYSCGAARAFDLIERNSNEKENKQ